jgi:hypothetical protein
MNRTAYAPQLSLLHDGKQPEGVEHPVVHFRRLRAEQQIALQLLIGDVKRAIAELAVAEDVCFRSETSFLDPPGNSGSCSSRHKGTGGARQMDDLATSEFSRARQDGFRPHR